jgi:repressor LexA
MRRILTKKQQKVLSFLHESVRKNGYPPSLSDICDHLGINAPKNARKHLFALEKKGFIRRTGSKSRAISLVREPDDARHLGPDAMAVWPRPLPESPGRTSAVPILGRVRAGAPRLAIEEIDGYMRLDTGHFKCDGAFILRAEGSSMTGAGISQGDLLVVRPASSAQNGDIVVAMLGDEATVKRLVERDGEVLLKPENPLMEPIRVSPSDAFSIIGRVMHVIKNV